MAFAMPKGQACARGKLFISGEFDAEVLRQAVLRSGVNWEVRQFLSFTREKRQLF